MFYSILDEMNEKYHYTAKTQERAVMVGAVLKPHGKDETKAHLDELALLIRTAGAEPVERFIQSVERFHPATFIGKGMLENIKSFVGDKDIQMVVFDEELSPTQLRNLERILKRKVLDRTALILDIFTSRAQTAHARIQVELAQYQYLLPRLAHRWTHLERQQGGIGLRGPGETEIETDRRIIREKISKLKKELLIIDRQKTTQRMGRERLIRVALVGYTNAGKSTLLNLLGKAQVLAEDKLFATLDTTVRKIVLEETPFLLADTVGFIHKLPHCLVESFKATLDEVRESDILLHVVDASHPRCEDQIRVVNATIKEIGAEGKPTVTVFNKTDLLPPPIGEPENNDIPIFPVSNLFRGDLSISVSAIKKTNMEALRKLIVAQVQAINKTRYPQAAPPS